jgi:hypothetical protein
MGYPVVSQYKYLGTWLNERLTLDTQIAHIVKKSNFIRSRLSPSLYNASLDFRRNMWQIFILPSYEFIIPLYYYETAKTSRQKLERLLRNSFKSYTGIKRTTSTDLINDLMAYNIRERSDYLFYVSEQKWRYRKRNEFYHKHDDENLESRKPVEMPNLCKNLPKSIIKYINLQTALCPHCKKNNIIVRLSKEHVAQNHNTDILSVHSIARLVRTFVKAKAKKNKNKKEKISRAAIQEYADSLIQENLDKLKRLLDG